MNEVSTFKIGMDEYHFEIHPTVPGNPLKILEDGTYHRKITIRRLTDASVTIAYTHLTGVELERMTDVIRRKLEGLLKKRQWEDLPAEFDLDSPDSREHRCRWHP